MRKILLASAAALTAGLGLAGAAQAQVSNPVMTGKIAPGTVVVRLDGRVSWFAGVSGFSGQSVAGTKYSGASFGSYVRLYPGFDGVAANGLQYGAQSEIRENLGSTAGTETLYVLRAFGYLGLPQAGLARFGQQEGALYLFDTGRFESGTDAFDDGGWNGDIQNWFVNSSARPVYPFTWSNSTRTTDKFDYISPVFSGFSFGASFEPNQTTEGDTVPVTSQPGGADLRRNTYELGIRYKQNLGPIGLNVSGGYMGAGAVSSSTGKGGIEPYQELSVGSAGAELTYAGFTFGGNTKFGNMNGQFEPNPTGASNAIGWLAGAVYTIGQLTVGGSYFDYQSTGDYSAPTLEGQRRETGAAAGVTYILVPGVKLFASYLYGTRHQGDFNFITSKVGSANNNMQAQVFALGSWIYW
jgi:outer membrane protein OmpU